MFMVSYRIAGISGNRCFDDFADMFAFVTDNKTDWQSWSVSRTKEKPLIGIGSELEPLYLSKYGMQITPTTQFLCQHCQKQYKAVDAVEAFKQANETAEHLPLCFCSVKCSHYYQGAHGTNIPPFGAEIPAGPYE